MSVLTNVKLKRGFCKFQVADFGLARYVIDDQYTSNGGAKFPIKWSPPEVLNYTRFSSKSDVWAFGVLCWEIMTCGEMPYGRAKNPEVVERVQRGQILSRPSLCPHKVYEVSPVNKTCNLAPFRPLPNPPPLSFSILIVNGSYQIHIRIGFNTKLILTVLHITVLFSGEQCL